MPSNAVSGAFHDFLLWTIDAVLALDESICAFAHVSCGQCW